MEALRLAFFLFVVVACVTAATRPEAPRRRSARIPPRRGSRGPLNTPTQPVQRPVRTGLYRNRWDRLDLARGIGRDFADPDIANR